MELSWVNGNTDLKIEEVLAEGTVPSWRKGQCWTDHMAEVFEVCRIQGVTLDTMEKCLTKIPLAPGMDKVFQHIRQHRQKYKEPTGPSKQPIRTRYLGHVAGYQPIRDQYFPIWSFRIDHLHHRTSLAIETSNIKYGGPKAKLKSGFIYKKTWNALQSPHARHPATRGLKGKPRAQLQTVFYNKWMTYESAVSKCQSLGMHLFCAKQSVDLDYVANSTCGPVWLDKDCLTCEGQKQEAGRRFLFCASEKWPSFVHPFPQHTTGRAVLECASSRNDSEVNWFYREIEKLIIPHFRSPSEDYQRVSTQPLSPGDTISLLQHDSVTLTFTFLSGYPLPGVTVTSGDIWTLASSADDVMTNDVIVWYTNNFAKEQWLYRSKFSDKVRVKFSSVVQEMKDFVFVLSKTYIVTDVPSRQVVTMGTANGTKTLNCSGHGMGSLEDVKTWWLDQDGSLLSPTSNTTLIVNDGIGNVTCLLDNGSGHQLTREFLVRSRVAPNAVGVALVTTDSLPFHITFHVPISRDLWEGLIYEIEVERSDGQVTRENVTMVTAENSKDYLDKNRWIYDISAETNVYKYRTRVVVMNEFGRSPFSPWSPWSVITSNHLPLLPSVSLHSVSMATVTLNISHPECEDIWVELSDGSQLAISAFIEPGKLKTFTNLTPGTQYKVTATATKDTLASDAAVFSFHTLSAPLASPTTLVVQRVNVKEEKAVIHSSWSYPGSRDSLSGFLLLVKRNGKEIRRKHISPFSSIALVSGLKLDHVYVVSVLAVGKDGTTSSPVRYTLKLAQSYCPLLDKAPEICSVVLRNKGQVAQVYLHKPSGHVTETGCYHGNGTGYHGNANKTLAGYPCIPWSSAPDSAYHNLTTNHCANPGGERFSPWCFDRLGEKQTCAVFPCGSLVTNISTNSNSSLKQVFSRLKTTSKMRKKLIVGNVCKDIIYSCATYPHEDSKVKATNRTIRLGGNAGNILQVMPQLPNSEGVCGYVKLGSCSYSQEAAEFLRGKLGNGTLYTSIQEGASLPESVLITSEGTGSRTCLHYRGDCEDLTLAEFQRDIDPGQFGWIHFEFRRNSEEVVKMIKFVREVNPAAQISLEVEKVRDHMDEAFGLVNWAIVSKEVSRDLGCETLDAALEFLAPKLECWNYRNGLVVTWGDQGAGFVERGVKGLCPVEKIPETEIVDSIGAGDTFTAVFIARFCLQIARCRDIKLKVPTNVESKEYEAFKCAMVAVETDCRRTESSNPLFSAWVKIVSQKAVYNNNWCQYIFPEPTDTSKQPIRTRYLGHVTVYQPIRDQYFLIKSVAPAELLGRYVCVRRYWSLIG
eukprot:sb/3461069/